MSKIKISAVSYLNTKPFLYGLEQSGLHKEIIINLANPADCAQSLLSNNCDLALLPVAILPELVDYKIISDYCIGAKGAVETVNLFSNVPLNSIETILLDYQSKTSVKLLKVLCKYYWKIHPVFKDAFQGYEQNIQGTTAGLIIGDRAIKHRNVNNYSFDLGEEWFKYTKLPFVFAAWVANKPLPDKFISQFNEALSKGIQAVNAIIPEYQKIYDLYDFNVKKYLTKSISFELDAQKQAGLSLFLKKIDGM